MLRYRARSSGAGFLGEAGIWKNNDWYELHLTQTGQPVFVNTEMCLDRVGEHFELGTMVELDHDFTLEKLEGGGGLRFHWESEEDSNGISFKMLGWVPEELKDFIEYSLADRPSYEVRVEDGDAVMNTSWPAWLEHLDLYDRLSPVTDLLSRTNPNVPETDIPSFVTESLRDAPSLIYQSGRSLLGFAGSTNLQYQFGWKPLIADLRNLINFGANTDKRLRRISKLARDKRLRTTRTLEQHDETQTESFEIWLGPSGSDQIGQFIPGGGTVTVDVTRHTVIERWGCVTYVPDSDFWEVWDKLPFDEKRWIACRSAFGLHAQNPAALWEVIPWSWLVDWFVPVQELLNTYNNFIPVRVRNLCVMTRSTTDFSFGSVSDGISLEEPTHIRRTTKLREVMAADGYLPNIRDVGVQLLSPRQIGILGSIAALKRGL